MSQSPDPSCVICQLAPVERGRISRMRDLSEILIRLQSRHGITAKRADIVRHRKGCGALDHLYAPALTRTQAELSYRALSDTQQLIIKVIARVRFLAVWQIADIWFSHHGARAPDRERAARAGMAGLVQDGWLQAIYVPRWGYVYMRGKSMQHRWPQWMQGQKMMARHRATSKEQAGTYNWSHDGRVLQQLVRLDLQLKDLFQGPLAAERALARHQRQLIFGRDASALMSPPGGDGQEAGIGADAGGGARGSAAHLQAADIAHQESGPRYVHMDDQGPLAGADSIAPDAPSSNDIAHGKTSPAELLVDDHMLYQRSLQIAWRLQDEAWIDDGLPLPPTHTPTGMPQVSAQPVSPLPMLSSWQMLGSWLGMNTVVSQVEMPDVQHALPGAQQTNDASASGPAQDVDASGVDIQDQALEEDDEPDSGFSRRRRRRARVQNATETSIVGFEEDDPDHAQRRENKLRFGSRLRRAGSRSTARQRWMHPATAAPARPTDNALKNLMEIVCCYEISVNWNNVYATRRMAMGYRHLGTTRAHNLVPDALCSLDVRARPVTESARMIEQLNELGWHFQLSADGQLVKTETDSLSPDNHADLLRVRAFQQRVHAKHLIDDLGAQLPVILEYDNATKKPHSVGAQLVAYRYLAAANALRERMPDLAIAPAAWQPPVVMVFSDRQQMRYAINAAHRQLASAPRSIAPHARIWVCEQARHEHLALLQPMMIEALDTSRDRLKVAPSAAEQQTMSMYLPALFGSSRPYLQALQKAKLTGPARFAAALLPGRELAVDIKAAPAPASIRRGLVVQEAGEQGPRTGSQKESVKPRKVSDDRPMKGRPS